MTVIEKEILRREKLIAEKSEKQQLVEEMKREIEKLDAEIAATDEVALNEEIAELKTYLPNTDNEPVPVVEPRIFGV